MCTGRNCCTAVHSTPPRSQQALDEPHPVDSSRLLRDFCGVECAQYCDHRLPCISWNRGLMRVQIMIYFNLFSLLHICKRRYIHQNVNVACFSAHLRYRVVSLLSLSLLSRFLPAINTQKYGPHPPFCLSHLRHPCLHRKHNKMLTLPPPQKKYPALTASNGCCTALPRKTLANLSLPLN